MPQDQHITRLLQRRDQLAEASTRALAHGAPDADVLGAELGALEDAIEQADPATYNRLLGTWLQADQDQLQAHLTGTAVTCADCARQRKPQHQTA